MGVTGEWFICRGKTYTTNSWPFLRSRFLNPYNNIIKLFCKRKWNLRTQLSSRAFLDLSFRNLISPSQGETGDSQGVLGAPSHAAVPRRRKRKKTGGQFVQLFPALLARKCTFIFVRLKYVSWEEEYGAFQGVRRPLLQGVIRYLRNKLRTRSKSFAAFTLRASPRQKTCPLRYWCTAQGRSSKGLF